MHFYDFQVDGKPSFYVFSLRILVNFYANFSIKIFLHDQFHTKFPH